MNKRIFSILLTLALMIGTTFAVVVGFLVIKPRKYSPPTILGVFLIDNGYHQLPENSGQPPKLKIPETKSSKPEIFYNVGDISNVSLSLVVSGSINKKINFQVKKSDGAFIIKPDLSLEPGMYCLIEGDPFSSFSFFSWWCFKVTGDMEANDNINISPDQIESGHIYVIVEDQPRSIGFQDSTDINVESLVKVENPTIILNTDLPLYEFELYGSTSGTGMYLTERDGYVVVTGFGGYDSVAKIGGILEGDIIHSVDGTLVNGNSKTATSILLGAPNTLVTLEVMRGSNFLSISIKRMLLGFWRDDRQDISIVSSTGYAELTPTYPLAPGVYCYMFSPHNSNTFPNPRMFSDDSICFVLE